MQVRGEHPQTGVEVDEWGCAIAWMPVLMINAAKEQRQTAAAVESFRNVVARAGSATMMPDHGNAIGHDGQKAIEG